MKKRGKAGFLLVVLVLAITMFTGCCTFRYLDGSSQEEVEKCENPLLWGKVATLEGQVGTAQQALREQEGQLGKLREEAAKSAKNTEVIGTNVARLAAAVGEEGGQGFEQGETAKERPSTGATAAVGKGSLMQRVAVLEKGMKKFDTDIVIRQGITVGTQAGKAATIKAIRYAKGTAGPEKVMVALDRMTIPQIFSLGAGNSRIVMDFFHAKCAKGIPLQTDIRGLYVQHVRIGKYLKPVQKTRIVIDLAPGKKYFADQTFDKKKKIYTLTVSPQE